MDCISCGYDNPATVNYCQDCGDKLDLTADEIQDSLVEKARGEAARKGEFYARQSIVFGGVLFVLGLVALIMSGGAPTDTYFMPSASNGADYIRMEYEFRAPTHHFLVSLEEEE